MTYNPEEFWKKNGIQHILREESIHNYAFEIYELHESKLLELLKKLEFKSVLELGCGFGRVTNLIMNNFDVEEYVAVDMSPEQLHNAQCHIHSKKIKFVRADITQLPDKIMNMKFDLVIATEVLMHIRPEDIASVIRTMVLLSKKHVVNVDYFDNEELMPHNFKHDYPKLYGSELEMIKIGKQCIFHFLV